MQKAAAREIFRTAAFLMEDCPELPVAGLQQNAPGSGPAGGGATARQIIQSAENYILYFEEAYSVSCRNPVISRVFGTP